MLWCADLTKFFWLFIIVINHMSRKLHRPYLLKNHLACRSYCVEKCKSLRSLEKICLIRTPAVFLRKPNSKNAFSWVFLSQIFFTISLFIFGHLSRPHVSKINHFDARRSFQIIIRAWAENKIRSRIWAKVFLLCVTVWCGLLSITNDSIDFSS